MDLLLLGAGMGIAGGMFPNPLRLIALTQMALGRWARAIFIILVPPLVVDGALLVVTLLFFRFIPLHIVHYVAYLGGTVVIAFSSHSLWELRRKSPDELAKSSSYTLAGVSVAALAELTYPGTWIYWLTIAGPILAEARLHGYGHVVPFFAGSLLGYYGAAVLSTSLIAWGAGLHRAFKKNLILFANILLLVLGISYLARAYFEK